MSIRIVHSGDSHIDSDTHGGVNPHTGLNRAWESHARALASAVDVALEQEASAFVHAGDAFKNGRPSAEAVLLFAETLKPLTRAGVPIVLIDGNHERHLVPTAQRTATANAASILSQFGEVHSVERVPELLRLDNGMQVACLPWLSKTTVLSELGEDALNLSPAEGDKAVTVAAMSALESMVRQADENAPLILASHVTMDDLSLDSLTPGHQRGSEMDLMHIFAEPILPRECVDNLPFSYAALSHIHARQQMGGKCFYAGSPDRLTMTDADTHKSVNLVTLADDNTLESVQKIDTDARAMTRIDLTDDTSSSRIDALREGTLVGLVLPPGEATPPPAVTKALREAGALLVDTARTPLRKAKTSAVVVPEKISPRKALSAWFDHTKPAGVDKDYLDSLATGLMED